MRLKRHFKLLGIEYSHWVSDNHGKKKEVDRKRHTVHKKERDQEQKRLHKKEEAPPEKPYREDWA
tara:strand:- start:3 stop:197 length:195 start_codon:yes stop_codon:yes gene_type:complete